MDEKIWGTWAYLSAKGKELVKGGGHDSLLVLGHGNVTVIFPVIGFELFSLMHDRGSSNHDQATLYSLIAVMPN